MITSIIVTYNGDRWIKDCLNSLHSANLDSHHIIVIDNHSADKTVSIIKKFSEVTLIELETNLGFGKANNIGLSIAKRENADYVFLLNQDAWILDNGLKKLIEISKTQEGFGILAPMQITKEGKLDLNFSHYVHPKKTPHLLEDIEQKKLKLVYPTEFANAGAWLITQDCLKKVGGFNPLFDHYGEDNNYIQRMKFHNLKIGITPTINVVHDRSQKKKSFNTTMALSQHLFTTYLVILLNPNITILKKHKQFIKILLKVLYKNDAGMAIKSIFFSIKKLVKNWKKICVSNQHQKKHTPAYID